MKKHRKPAELPYRRGVGAVLFNRHGRVFVAKRIDTPGDAWQLPQGGIDSGEAPKRAILRELAEEIGTANVDIVAKSSRWLQYDLPPVIAARVWGGRYRGQKQRWYALRFRGADAEIDLAATTHPEFDAWRWVRLDDLPSLAVPFKRPLYERLVIEFAPVALHLATGSAPGGEPLSDETSVLPSPRRLP